MKRLIDRALESLEKPLAMRVLFWVSFAESALLPIPVESIYLPLLTARKSPWPAAFWGTAGSVLGGIVGYLIGLLLLESVGEWMIEIYKMEAQYEQMQAWVAEDPLRGALLVLAGALTPVPYKVVSIVSGAMAFSFPFFVLASVVGRAIRFYLFALVFAFYGDSVRDFVRRKPRLISALVIVVTVAGVLAVVLKK